MSTQRLAQVAEMAGVSTTTVSRVLNGNRDVAPATREAVLTAVDVCGFERPVEFRKERAQLIGLVVPDLQNPVFSAAAEALAGLLNGQGLVPVLCTRTADGVSESHYVDMLLGQNVGGIVFVGASYTDIGEAQGRELRRRAIPVVLVNPADENPGVAQVSVDDAGAAEQALEHLSALGHERIGMIVGPSGHVPSVRKLAGYAAFNARRGVPAQDWRPLVAHALFSMEGGATAISQLLPRGVTAVVCASDALALGAIRGARRRGLRVPAELSVVGFDDSLFMVATDPPLTTARQPVAAMASAAVQFLAEQIRTGVALSSEILFDTELIVRSSTTRRSSQG
ncbi:LacI family DNA-binding transcriptional regulator [Streptomyces sp. NPDC058401]|uniref:LacI family DNA-binding transcriptional regulator n=1 Tax=Streptomyces sp. NPDC058401 TaxID=3346480 RepID=UPI00365E244B